MRTLLCLFALLAAAPLAACQIDPISLTLEQDGTVTLRNGSGVPIHYQGYAPDSPLFTTESWKGGDWESTPIGFCGTGLARQTLAAGAAVQFQAQSPADAVRWRVVLAVTRAEGEAELFSNPVDVERPSP